MLSRVGWRMVQGLMWGSVLVHASGLWRPAMRWTRAASFAFGRTDAEQAALCLTALIVMIVEPMAYLFYTIRWANQVGAAGLLILVPLALTHLGSWTLPPIRAFARKLEARAQ